MQISFNRNELIKPDELLNERKDANTGLFFNQMRR